MAATIDFFTGPRAKDGKYVCKQPGCGSPFTWKKGQGTGALTRHMRNDHKKVWDAHLAAQAEAKDGDAAAADDASSVFDMSQGAPAAAAAASSSGSKRSSSDVHSVAPPPKRAMQQTLRSSFAASHNMTLPQQTALFFASNHISYNAADSASFHAISMAAAFRASTAPVPRRRAIAAAVGTLAESLRDAVIQRITGGTAPVTVAIDGWTNVRHSKVTNVVLLCSGVAFYWCSIPNSYTANTAVWIEAQLTPKLQELVALGIRFTALVADNESVNDKLFSLLTAPFPFLIRIPCAAHTIQLVVKQIMLIKKFAATLDTARGIISSFEKQKADRLRLRKLQADTGHELQLVKACDTRWNSHLYACERLLKLRHFITLIYPQPDAFWTALSDLIDYLRPFQAATDVIQRDAATLFDVWSQMNTLLQHIAAGRAKHGASVTARATAALKERWNKQVNQPATIACALLSLSADLSPISAAVIDEAKQFILSFGSSYLRFYELSALEQPALEGTLLQQLASFVGRRDRFERVAEQIALLKAAGPFNPLDIWDSISCELSLVAKALLCITASEAAVERTFSAQDAVHTKKRNRLLDATVQNEMFVKFNTRALDRDQHYQLPAATIELSPDVDFLPQPDAPNSDDEHDASDEDEPAAEPPAAAAAASSAAAAAAAAGPASMELDADDAVHDFLESFIDRHGITLENYKKRWPEWRMTALETAAAEAGPFRYTPGDLRSFIKHIIEKQHGGED